MTDPADRSIAAEARGVEENHQARLIVDADGPHIAVKSDSVDGRTYRVTAHAPNGEGSDIIFTCKPSDLGQPGRRRDHGLKCTMDGTTACKHATRAARRLERAGLIRWIDPHRDQDIVYPGRWVAARATAPLVTDDLTEGTPAERWANLPTDVNATPPTPTESAAYRQAMAKLTPADDALFASFANADHR